MRITTWNVNGLRSILNKGAMDWIDNHMPDILCLQEIKVKPDQLEKSSTEQLSSYRPVWHPSERGGYSGVATLSQTEPEFVKLGIGEGRFDVEGRVIITRHQDIILFNIYFPNGKRDHNRLRYKLDFYSLILEKCVDFQSKGENLILCGDFNTAHNEIDLRNPKQNQLTSGFLPEERAWIDRYLEKNFVDAYRELYPQRVQYTWWTYRYSARQRNIGWRLDYFLVSAELMPRIKDVIIHDDILGSDHCPVSLLIDCVPVGAENP